MSEPTSPAPPRDARCLRARPSPARGRGVAATAHLLCAYLLGCGGPSDGEPEPAPEPAAGSEASTACPAQARAPERLPGVLAEHERLDYWITRAAAYGDVDAPLLSADEVRDHALSMAHAGGDDGPIGQVDLLEPLRTDRLLTSVNERFAFLRERFASGAFVHADGGPWSGEERRALRRLDTLPPVAPSLHVALEPIDLRCAPFETGYFTPTRDLDFDRNACSTVRPQEVVQVLARWPGGLRLARTRYAIGFIADAAALSPPVPVEHEQAFVRGPFVFMRGAATLRGSGGASVTLPAGARVPTPAPGEALGMTAMGVVRGRLDAEGVLTERPLTRRGVLTEAFALLGTPYGWGDHAGGRDCSRYLLDIFDTFGLPMPRHSAQQARAGSFVVDVEGIVSERDKLEVIEEAARSGIVLLHFPGHIMLYLGRDAAGTPMVIHSFSEYLSPCQPEGETLMRVDRVAVSDLTLGADTTRRSFMARITKVIVLGRAPTAGLQGAAERRPAAPPSQAPEACDDSVSVALFQSPRRPNPQQPLRVMVSSSEDLGPIALALFDPAGQRHVPAVHVLGGPPFTYWAEQPSPVEGTWTAVAGDGTRVLACERIHVRGHRGGLRRHEADVDPAWRSVWRWDEDTENLYAGFVEQLFAPTTPGQREAPPEESTWPNLSVLVRDPARNLLHDHFGAREDERVRLRPDCADLPYFLRAYFAWKLHLPFAFRACNRGADGRPPACDGTPQHNHLPVPGTDEVNAFQEFSQRVANTVHSASARTHPDSNATDVYPVPLRRESLAPGTVFADPYGHLLIIARWIPQTATEYGVLIGADAQPDGTVALRRFWRGSFLFSPDTSSAGAGFKAFRPVRARREGVQPRANDALVGGPRAWSRQQYAGSADDFYDRMEALINPRPLEPSGQLRVLVDALDEAAQRRVQSVDNGEAYVRQNGPSVPMPEGYAIFETTGPWEDFATPSRDMRLLISIDAVTGFPASVVRQPGRFGVGPADAAAVASRLEGELSTLLAGRAITYRRSDGAAQRVTLQDLVARQRALELAYNPNDCIEQRWGAPAGSAEASSCRRHAPPEQARRMAEYRAWFARRQRPAR
ncbi:MAG: C40 family peptidase [Sandaracinaceae bacterium]|nr:C40 family peptidase [Sandaracinaceae bacterium]